MTEQETAIKILDDIIDYHLPSPYPDTDLAKDAIKRLRDNIVCSNRICDYCQHNLACDVHVKYQDEGVTCKQFTGHKVILCLEIKG